MEFQCLSNKTHSQNQTDSKLTIELLHFALPFFPGYHEKNQTYIYIIKRLLIDHKRTCGNVFHVPFFPRRVESQSENKTGMYYLPITLIYSTPSIAKHMTVFAEQVNKNAIIKGNTRLKIICLLLTISSFGLSSTLVECLIFCNFNYIICKLEPDAMKGFHSFQNRIKQ